MRSKMQCLHANCLRNCCTLGIIVASAATALFIPPT